MDFEFAPIGTVRTLRKVKETTDFHLLQTLLQNVNKSYFAFSKEKLLNFP